MKEGHDSTTIRIGDSSKGKKSMWNRGPRNGLLLTTQPPYVLCTRNPFSRETEILQELLTTSLALTLLMMMRTTMVRTRSDSRKTQSKKNTKAAKMTSTSTESAEGAENPLINPDNGSPSQETVGSSTVRS